MLLVHVTVSLSGAAGAACSCCRHQRSRRSFARRGQRRSQLRADVGRAVRPRCCLVRAGARPVSWSSIGQPGHRCPLAVAAFALLGVGGAVAGTPAEAGSQPTDESTTTAAAVSSASSQAATTMNRWAPATPTASVLSISSAAARPTNSCCSQADEKNRAAANGTALAADGCAGRKAG